MDDLPPGIRERLRALPAGLRGHIERVVVEARRLAAVHRMDAEQAERAAWLHDLLRATPGDELLALTERYGYQANEVQRRLPMLLHGPLAAELLRREYGERDPDVLDAVRWHTSGDPAMDGLPLLLFVADKVEPEKLRLHPGQDEVRELANRDLRAAALRYLELLEARLAAGLPPRGRGRQAAGALDPHAEATRAALEAAVRQRGRRT